MSDLHLNHIAKLAQLHLTKEELSLYESQVASILKWVEELKEVPVDGVLPTSHPFNTHNVFREDKENPPASITEFLKHAPASYKQFFEVPKVIESS